MRSLTKAAALVLLTVAAGTALAHNCPNEMKAIDAKLATHPTLTADNAAKVKQLRADGEVQHKAGKHDESMKSLAEAKKILGI
jgi:hypothetical protein